MTAPPPIIPKENPPSPEELLVITVVGNLKTQKNKCWEWKGEGRGEGREGGGGVTWNFYQFSTMQNSAVFC